MFGEAWSSPTFSWPFAPLPQQNAMPSAVTPQVCAPGVALRDVKGTRATPSGAEPERSPLLAVRDTVPVDKPVTPPLADTMARAVSDTCHKTGRPVTTWPAVSYTVATNAHVVPTGNVIPRGCTVTDSTGRTTSSLLVATRSPSLAKMVVWPGATPVATPTADTLATVVSALVHWATVANSVSPAESTATVRNSVELPRNTEASTGVTASDAAG